MKTFVQRVRDGEEIAWAYELSVADSRKKGATQEYRIHVGEQMGDGSRILWIHSASKEHLEQSNRERKIAKAEQALEKLSSGLNQRALKTREQIEQGIKTAVQGASAYLSVTIHEERTSERVQVGRGRPGPNTPYEEKERICYRLEWTRNQEAITRARRSDGLFPLVHNTSLAPIEVLRTYKDQPYLEKRFSTKKSVLEVAPVFLERPQRIEAMMFLYFVALMLVSLIERRIRMQMQQENIEKLPMRPAGMYTDKPTWRTIRDSFDGVHLATVVQSGKVIQAALKGMTALRQQILRLLQVPRKIYTRLRDGWWRFSIA